MSAAVGSATGRFRIGSVPYLNAVPLVHGLGAEVRLAPPSQLARWLRAGEVDAGLVSITEVLEHDGYDLVDGIGVVSDGPVYSVFLAHRGNLEAVRRVACDPASLTSVRLLQCLLASRGIRPEWRRLEASQPLDVGSADGEGFLLIGDPAIAFRSTPASATWHLWDLGEAWKRWTGLPFVYAAWAVRRDRQSTALIKRLIEARDAGADALGEILRTRPEFDLETRTRYLRQHIHYHVGERERAGVAQFVSELRRLGIVDSKVPRWIGPAPSEVTPSARAS